MTPPEPLRRDGGAEPRLARSRLAANHPSDGTGSLRDSPAGFPLSASLLASLAGVTLGAVLPILMTVANKSAPASLGAAALFANLAAVQAGLGSALRARYRRFLTHAPTAAVVAVVLVSLGSLAWSIDPAMTRRGLIEAVPELVFALMLAAGWPLVARGRDIVWLIVGLFGAALLIAFEYRFGMPIHALIRSRGEAWDLKRSAIPPVLLLWPAVAFCIAAHRPVMASALGVAAVVGVVVAHSGAPGFALVAAAALGALARFAPRATLAGTACLIIALIVLGSWTGTLAHRPPPEVETALAEEHAAHRVRIWSAFEARAHDRWALGHGFNASYTVSQVPRADGKPPGPDNAEMVNNHPHDIFLQIWVELGLLGAVVAVGVFALVVSRLARLAPTVLASRLALLISVVGIGLVGLSAWQPWWLASIAASLLWFDFVDERFHA